MIAQRLVSNAAAWCHICVQRYHPSEKRFGRRRCHSNHAVYWCGHNAVERYWWRPFRNDLRQVWHRIVFRFHGWHHYCLSIKRLPTRRHGMQSSNNHVTSLSDLFYQVTPHCIVDFYQRDWFLSSNMIVWHLSFTVSPFVFTALTHFPKPSYSNLILQCYF